MDLTVLKSRIPHSFWRFALVGIGGLLVDLTVLYAGLWGLGLPWFLAKVFSFFTAATFTWWMNRQYNFGKSDKSIIIEWGSFLATNAFGGFVNLSIYTAAVTQFPPYVWMPAVATGLGSLGGLFFNYLLSKHIVFSKISKQEIIAKYAEIADVPPFPRILYLITFLVCLTFGLVALWFGMDTRWDLTTYPLYNDWAFVNGLADSNWLLSQIANLYNPLLEAPYTMATERLPAHAIGFALGTLHGFNFLPLSAIAWHLLTLTHPRHRLYASAILALVGLCGAGGLSEIGIMFYDNVLSLGVLASILLVVSNWNKIIHGSKLTSIAWTAAAGVPVGMVFGLKQSMVIYCVGLTVAFLVADMPPLRRVRTSFCFGIGVLIGFALSGGYWAVHLWKTVGNPFFPYFNQTFRSLWVLPVPYRAPDFIPQGLVEKILFVFRFSFNSHLCGETGFRDFRILALLILLLLAALARIWRKQPHPFTHPGPTVWILVAGLVTYAIWVPWLAIYRYIVPLEILAPLLSIAAIGLLPLGKRTRLGAAVSLIAFLTVSTIPSHWLQTPWVDSNSHFGKNAVIPAGMPESSAMDGNESVE